MNTLKVGMYLYGWGSGGILKNDDVILGGVSKNDDG